jgi:hypothetical protein
MTRVNDRQGFDASTRLTLVETDMDKNDQGMEGIKNEIKALRSVLVGILISAATASVLLAINVVVQNTGG